MLKATLPAGINAAVEHGAGRSVTDPDPAAAPVHRGARRRAQRHRHHRRSGRGHRRLDGHQPPAHIPSPPGTSFVTPPTNKATVQVASATVTIGGQAAARAGDIATTCNDPVDAAGRHRRRRRHRDGGGLRWRRARPRWGSTSGSRWRPFAGGRLPLEAADSWGGLDLGIGAAGRGIPGHPGGDDLTLAAERANLGQALILRLLTPLGQPRAARAPDYGSRLTELIGERNDEAHRNLARLFTIQAVAQERRAVLTDLAVDVPRAGPRSSASRSRCSRSDRTTRSTSRWRWRCDRRRRHGHQRPPVPRHRARRAHRADQWRGRRAVRRDDRQLGPAAGGHRPAGPAGQAGVVGERPAGGRRRQPAAATRSASTSTNCSASPATPRACGPSASGPTVPISRPPAPSSPSTTTPARRSRRRSPTSPSAGSRARWSRRSATSWPCCRPRSKRRTTRPSSTPPRAPRSTGWSPSSATPATGPAAPPASCGSAGGPGRRAPW